MNSTWQPSVHMSLFRKLSLDHVLALIPKDPLYSLHGQAVNFPNFFILLPFSYNFLPLNNLSPLTFYYICLKVSMQLLQNLA
jgi:hypothetical protein